MKAKLLTAMVLVGMVVASSFIPSSLPAGQNGMAMRSVYPNPFTISTTFQLTMPKSGNITIAVFDLLGRHMKTLFQGEHEQGKDNIFWDGNDDTGKPVIPGIYICSLFADNNMVTSVKVVKIPA
ncbi:MAG: Por secretion system C-terminal sorting protein [Chlorobi bacterium]|nr:Por secretion system C-terminal sorting protein [Chlorobiota bacterium]